MMSQGNLFWYHLKGFIGVCMPNMKSWPVFAKLFRFLPDIRSGKQIFFTSPNKNLPDRIKRADLPVVKKKHKQKQTTVLSLFLLFCIKNNTHQQVLNSTSAKFVNSNKSAQFSFSTIISFPLFPFDTELLCRSVGIIFFPTFFLRVVTNINKA